jgi:hypothetical protein
MSNRSVRIAVILVASLATGCTSAIPADPAALPGQPLVFTFDGRNNVPVILRIGSVEIARIGCQDATQAFTPGQDGVPLLPWDLQVLRQSDGRALLSAHITSMPKWLLMFDDNPQLGVIPALGPAPPSCAP